MSKEESEMNLFLFSTRRYQCKGTDTCHKAHRIQKQFQRNGKQFLLNFIRSFVLCK